MKVEKKKLPPPPPHIMAVLSIFLLSILLPACSKKEQAKTTRLYTKQEALKMYHKDQIPEKDGINDNQIKTRSEAIAEYQNRRMKNNIQLQRRYLENSVKKKKSTTENQTYADDPYERCMRRHKFGNKHLRETHCREDPNDRYFL